MGDNISKCWNYFSKTKGNKKNQSPQLLPLISRFLPKLINPSEYKGYSVENHLKHHSDFFKRHGKTNLIIFKIRVPQPESFGGGGGRTRG